MRRLRRILVTIVVTLSVIFIGLYWVAPIALSFYSARKALPITKIVPTDLTDVAISQSPGARLSYLGYDFEVPWSDLDESKTKLYPENKPEKTMAILIFRSGLKLTVLSARSRSFADQFVKDMKMSPQAFEAVFGHAAASSDYAFMRCVFEFTPDKMHHWALWPQPIDAREEALLVIKSILPSKPAETGIFKISNGDYRGFQQGDPRIRQDFLLVDLYSDSDNGGVEIGFLQKNYANSTGVTQPEINRIVQSLHRAAASEVAATRN